MSIKTATLNGVATIEIARPEKKNALTIAMYQAMAEALDAAQADATIAAGYQRNLAAQIKRFIGHFSPLLC